MTVGRQYSAETGAVECVIPLGARPVLPIGLVGSKAANLARMLAAGLPVPRGFCVTTRAYRQWFDTCPAAAPYLDRLEQLTPTDLESIKSVAAELRQTLAGVPIPPLVAAAVVEACAGQGEDLAWAVRSSATTEDGHETSFAGQHDTLLNVRGPAAVVDAIRRCWISLFTDRAVAYRLRNHLPHRSAAMAVLVQEMVPADSAGVVFTSDPITGDPGRIMIEATPGLGDALVSGKVTPDRFVVARETLDIVDRQVNPAFAGAVADQRSGAGQQVETQERAGGSALNDSLARRLTELALQAERLLGAPQDVEWAVAGGRAFLLQSRPITRAPAWRAPTPDVWSNANMCENLPDVLTPMGWSVFEALVVGIFRPLLRQFGIDLDARPWFGLIAGRVYLNLTVTQQVFRGLQSFADVDLGEMLGGLQLPSDALTSAPPTGQRLWSLRQLPWLFRVASQLVSRNASRRGVAYLTTLRERLDELAGTDFRALSDPLLADFIPAMRQRAFPETDRPGSLSPALACMVLGWAASIAALRLSRRWLGDQDGSVAKRLLAGTGNMASAESALDLWRLAAWACEHSEVARLLQAERPFAALRAELEATATGREFLDRWNGWMTRHGHHARGEMDIYRPRWFETPGYVLDLLRGYLVTAQTNDVLQGQAGRSHERQRLLETSRQRLRNPVKRWLFTTLIDRARHGLAFRENVKSEAVRGVTLIRMGLFEAGDRLVRSGVLNTRDDVFFLTLPELREALTRRTGFDASPLVVPRKAEFARNRSIQPPPVVGGLPDLTARATRGPGVPAHVTAAVDQRNCLVGLAVSPGLAVGKARVILRADDHECLRPGEILVAPATDPGWTPYFLGAAGIVVDIGGQLSHGSILAREFGIPAVVNVGDATRRIRTGQVIRVDANRGIVTIED